MLLIKTLSQQYGAVVHSYEEKYVHHSSCILLDFTSASMETDMPYHGPLEYRLN